MCHALSRAQEFLLKKAVTRRIANLNVKRFFTPQCNGDPQVYVSQTVIKSVNFNLSTNTFFCHFPPVTATFQKDTFTTSTALILSRTIFQEESTKESRNRKLSSYPRYVSKEQTCLSDQTRQSFWHIFGGVEKQIRCAEQHRTLPFLWFRLHRVREYTSQNLHKPLECSSLKNLGQVSGQGVIHTASVAPFAMAIIACTKHWYAQSIQALLLLSGSCCALHSHPGSSSLFQLQLPIPWQTLCTTRIKLTKKLRKMLFPTPRPTKIFYKLSRSAPGGEDPISQAKCPTQWQWFSPHLWRLCFLRTLLNKGGIKCPKLRKLLQEVKLKRAFQSTRVNRESP